MGVQDDIRRFENEVFLADPLTGFGSRHNLIEDLTAALVPESSPRLVAVFDLAGWKDYRRVYGERESDVLIARLAEVFSCAVRPAGACYRPREDEFCVLADVSIDVDSVRTMLAAAAGAVWDEGQAFMISSWYGAALLPEEASDAIDALMLADERLRTRTENRQPRERRQSSRPA